MSEAKLKNLERLKALSLRRNDARKSNHIEVVEEDRRSKLPKNWEAREYRLKAEEEKDLFKERCKEQQLDPDRVELLSMSADVADKLDAKKRKRKANADQGFSTYADASHKKYLKQTRQIKVDLKAYEKQKESLGELAYPNANTIGLIGTVKDDPSVVQRFADEVTTASEKKQSYSRRRAYDNDADIDYINERNKRYNELLDRHYGKYTAEIKQNLERGTAI